MHPKWERWRTDYLREWYGKKDMIALSKVLRKSKKSIYQMAYQMHLSRPRKTPRGVTPDQYIEMISEAALQVGLRPAKVLGGSKTIPALTVKHGVWRRLRDSGESFMSIGAVSGHDHSTVVKVLNRVRPTLEAAE